MNIAKLEVGKTFKNYKELCVELGWEVKKSTDTKNAQFKELSRYCKYSKQGHKFYIEEVYDSPLPKVDNRGKDSVYGKLVQLLIADLLAQCEGHVSISRSRLMTTIGMVNINYGECKELVKKLSKYTGIEEKIIYDFYNTSASSFKSVIETALNNLMDKRVIMYNKVIKISETGSYITRIANEFELELIMEIEKDTLEQLGYKEISAVRVSKDWRKFRSITKRQLHEQSNIAFYYTAYDITINSKYILEECHELATLLLEQMKRQESKDELNKLIYSQLLMNAQKRHEKSKEFTSSRKMKNTRSDESYVEYIKQLSDLLIDKNANNIAYQVRNIKLETMELDGIDEELEKLFA